jgi:cysteine desulfurase/selenocysteine lyase
LTRVVVGDATDRAAGRDGEFPVERVRRDFPSLHQEVHPGVSLVYLDSAATSLKPEPVIRAVSEYMSQYPANVHRGLHVLSERATEAYEGARARVASYLGADAAEIVFTRGTTESINLVALSWGQSFLAPGDAILLNELEHHSNLVPWQLLARNRGVRLEYVPLSSDGRIDLEAMEAMLGPRVRLVAITGMSNVTGTIPPLDRICELAHGSGARVLVDAAQSLPHHRLDVRRLGADFVAFSGHKLCGPTGVGVLYARRELLEEMPPVFGGGNMVMRVERERSEWNEVPWKFEAGTPPIAEAIGLGAAIDYLSGHAGPALAEHERTLLTHAHAALGRIDGVRILGPEPGDDKGPIVGFTLEGAHPHDVAQLVDRKGIAIRAGHHCAMPLHSRLGITASARASLFLYNTVADIDRLAEALVEVRELLSRRGRRPAVPPSPKAASATENRDG